MYESLHKEVAVAVSNVRSELRDANVGSTFELTIKASGRVQEGEVLVSYKVSKEYGTGEVSGARLEPVVEEFLRRQGWSKRHAPLALEAPVEQVTEGEDIPF